MAISNNENTMSYMRRIAIVAYVVFALTLAVATFVEWQMGTRFIHENVYGTWWFAGIMAILGISGTTVCIVSLRRNKPAMVVHLALATILVGALITRLIGVQGSLFLREGVRTDVFLMSDSRMAHMPMGLTLSSFDIICYPGTEAPMDYRSVVMTDDSLKHVISMNEVLTIRGYRFYQSNYTAEGSVLSVNYDPYGIAVSYIGYVLLAFGLIIVLLNRKGRFRTLLRELSVSCLLMVFLVSCSTQVDKDIEEITPTLEMASCTDDLLMLYNDRIVPFNTYAIDFTLKLTGRNSFRGLTAEQFLLGWYSKPKQWGEEPCLLLKEPLPSQCGISSGIKYISLNQLFDKDGNYILASFFRRGERPPKSVSELNERVQLIVMLTSGEVLKFFPMKKGEEILWQHASDNVEAKVYMSDFKYNLEYSHEVAFRETCASIIDEQRIKGGDTLPSLLRVEVEKIYNALRLTTWLFRVALTLGLILLVVSIVVLSRKMDLRLIYRLGLVTISTVFVVHTLSIVMRTIISGNLPMSTGHETMLFLAWSIMLVAIIIRRLMPLIMPFGLLLSGFTLLVANIGLNNPHITPLMPVLHSPWLSSHVATIMISYALFSILAINSVIGLLLKAPEQTQRMAKVSLVLLYPAVTLLSIGIFIGAVWANESWGRYWAWDPKEVWALITMLVYAVPLHQSLVPQLNKPKMLHVYLLCAFVCVLMTYFGVNYLLGGMHSYGG